MNTKLFFSALVVASLTIVSCKKELQPQESSTDTTAVANTPADPNAITPTQVTPVQPNQVTQAQPQQVNPQQMQTMPVQPQPAKTAKGMNPPHGQPGHRCDIAVGAPLNSAPSKPATPAAQTINPTTVQKGLPAANNAPVGVAAPGSEVETPPGMNPPHGKPGHDCAVAVGAPLPKK